jgi:hypothetical protein
MDLKAHFQWNLAETQTVNTSGVCGDCLLVVLMGFLMKSAGPAVTSIPCLVLLSSSFFGLYWLAATVPDSSMVLACFFYLCNGWGGNGFFLVAVYTITTTWPEHLVGTSIAIVEVAKTLGSVGVAKMYVKFTSIPPFFFLLAWMAFTIGFLMFSINVKWSQLIKWYQKKQKSEKAVAETEDSPSKSLEEQHLLDAEKRLSKSLEEHHVADIDASPDGSHHRITRSSTSFGYGAVEHEDVKKKFISRHATSIADDIIADRTHKEEFFEIFGVTPTYEELHTKYPDIPVTAALFKLEFGIIVAFMLFGIAPSSVLLAMNLAFVQDLTGAHAWMIADLLAALNVSRVVGKILGGVICDTTAHSKIITKPFFIACASFLVLCSLASLQSDKCGTSCLVSIMVVNGFALGVAQVTMQAMLKHCFGARTMSMFISLSFCFFFMGFSFWGFTFVQVNSSEGSLKFLNMWLVVSCGCLIPLALASWAWISDLSHVH